MSVRGECFIIVFVNIVKKGFGNNFVIVFEKGDKECIKIVLDSVRGELLL